MQWLIDKQKFFEKIIGEIKKEIKTYPEGSLKAANIKKGNKTYCQYSVRNTKEKKVKYLGKGQKELIRKLAQKEYMKKVLALLERDSKVIKNLLDTYDPDALKKVYENLSPGKKELVVPYQYPDKEFAELWQAKKYEGKPFGDDEPEIYTKKGERVRSKSEQIIADRLYDAGVPYRYEYPLYTADDRPVYVDFTILNVKTRTEYRLEHFGMMDSPEYRSNAFKKIASYAQAGWVQGKNILYTFEDRQNPLDTRYLDKLIKRFFL